MSNPVLATANTLPSESAFETVCQEMTPDGSERLARQAERLAPYRKVIMKQRGRGLSWKQLAQALGDPRVNVKVTANLLEELYGPKDKKPSPATPKAPAKKAAPKPRAAAPAKPAAPAPAAPPPPQPTGSKDPFDRAAYEIITRHRVDDLAVGTLAEFYVAAYGENTETEAMNRFIEDGMARLDGLARDAALAKYCLTPEQWYDWRPRWCKFRGLPIE